MARRKQGHTSSGNPASTLCTTCQNHMSDAWPYLTADQVALPSLQQVLTRHEEPGAQSSRSQISISAFLKPSRHSCSRSKAGKGMLSVPVNTELPSFASTPELSTIHVDVETARNIEQRTPGSELVRSNSGYFAPV